MWLSKHLSMVLGLALLGAACISSEPPPAEVDPVVVAPVTTAPAEPLEPVDEATIALVEDYWEARDAAWAAGVEAGLAFSVATDHPLLAYTADDCREAWVSGEPPGGCADRNALAPAGARRTGQPLPGLRAERARGRGERLGRRHRGWHHR